MAVGVGQRHRQAGNKSHAKSRNWMQLNVDSFVAYQNCPCYLLTSSLKQVSNGFPTWGRPGLAIGENSMLTETEVMAKAIAKAISGQTTFGKSQCETAMKTVSALVKAGQVSDDDADRARARLGNHSAVRQHLEKHGLITVPADALANAISEETARLVEVEAKEMAEMTSKKK
jgi:hypothetical protein